MGRLLTQEDKLDRAMSENDLLRAVMDLAFYNRFLAHHMRRSDRAIQQGESGFPDVLAAKPPRLLVIELKRQTEYPTALQRKWLDYFEAVPGVEVFVWRPSDLRTGEIERVFNG